MKAFLESPDGPPSMPSQKRAALEEHVKALEQQDVILAINRSHEHFDQKGASKLGRHIRVEGSSDEQAPSLSLSQVEADCLMLVLHAQVLRPRKGRPESIRAPC